MNALSKYWSQLLAHSGEAALWTYVIIGVVIWLYVLYRYSGWSQRRKSGNYGLWPRSENPQQGLRYFFFAGGLHPVLLVIQIAFWPLWLLFLWAYAPEQDDANIQPCDAANRWPAYAQVSHDSNLFLRRRARSCQRWLILFSLGLSVRSFVACLLPCPSQPPQFLEALCLFGSLASERRVSRACCRGPGTAAPLLLLDAPPLFWTRAFSRDLVQ